MRLAALLLVLGAALTLVGVNTALAHAYLDHADPAPGSTLAQAPTQLRLTFSEDVDPTFSQVRVLNADRQPVDAGDSHLDSGDPKTLIVSLQGGLGDGIYTVAWRTLSADDGHTVNGAYTLAVGALASPPAASQAESLNAEFSPETALARWWLYLAAALVFGPLLTWRIVFRPLLVGNANVARSVASHRTRKLALVGAAALVVGTLYAAVAQAASATGLPLWAAFGSPVEQLLSAGHYAAIWWPRLVLAVLVLACVGLRSVDGLAGDVALAIMPAVLLTSSLGSHAAAVPGWSPLAIGADWLHLLSVTAWLGGLASMVFVLPAVARVEPHRGSALFSRPVARFSNVALLCVLLVALTGTFQAWLELGSWQALVATAYGLSVSAKIALTLVMLAFGAFNFLVAHPRVAVRLAPGLATVARAARMFRRSVRAELTVGVLILAIAAVLTGLAPGRADLAQQSGEQTSAVDRSIAGQGISGRVRISPATVGQDQFTFELPATDPSTVERVQFNLTYLDGDLGSERIDLAASPGSATTWQADSPALSQPGQWQADLLIRRVGQDDVRSTLRFTVIPQGSTGQVASSAAYPPVPTWMGIALGAVVALVGGGMIATALIRMRRRRPTPLDSERLRVALRGSDFESVIDENPGRETVAARATGRERSGE